MAKVRTPFGVIETGDSNSTRPEVYRTPFGVFPQTPAAPTDKKKNVIRTPFGTTVVN